MTDSPLAQLIARLSPEERESFLEILRDANTYIAEDMTDILAILESLPKKPN